jgi:cell division protein FtsN
MEKKKIILISVIIGLFLFIAIALPLSLLSSKDNNTLAGTSPVASGIYKPEETYMDRPASMDVRDTIVDPPTAPPDAQNSSIIINNYDTTSAETAESKTLPAEGGDLTLTIVPAVPAAAQTPPAPSSTTPRSPQIAPSGGKSQTTPPKQTPSKPVKTTAKPPTSSVKYDYWIQTGSFSKKLHAENAQKALKEEGISSTIMDAVVNGQNVFRVRTGPYTTNSEATYWLKLIKVIDIAGLEESWIAQVAK